MVCWWISRWRVGVLVDGVLVDWWMVCPWTVRRWMVDWASGQGASQPCTLLAHLAVQMNGVVGIGRLTDGLLALSVGHWEEAGGPRVAIVPILMASMGEEGVNLLHLVLLAARLHLRLASPLA